MSTTQSPSRNPDVKENRSGHRGILDTPHSEELRENLSEVGTSLRRAVSQTMPAAKEVLNRISDDVTEKTVGLEDAIIDYIREKPIHAALVCGGLGLICGFFLRRR